MSGLDDEAIRPKSAYFVRKAATAANPTTPQTTPSKSQSLNIAGTRASLHNNQLLLSPIGIPSIDYFLGTTAIFRGETTLGA